MCQMSLDTVQLLDVTLRDGSNVINYQFTPKQVGGIVQALDAAGVPFIEVGHGGGLGARENLGIASAASDGDYVRAARAAARRAKIGVLAGPASVTHPENIDAVRKSIDFIRVAANADECCKHFVAFVMRFVAFALYKYAPAPRTHDRIFQRRARLEEIFRALSLRPCGELDQGKMPRGA